MTLTTDRPQPTRHEPPGAPRRGTDPNRRRIPLERDVAATLALTGYSLAVAIGFARVFSGWEFLFDLALLAVLGHGSSFVMRRLGWSGWITIPAMALLQVWAIALIRYSDATTAVFPWGSTWNQFSLDVGVVRDQFQTAVAPVIYDVGWAALAGLAMVLVITMSDAFAFRAEARGEALVPGGVLFVFIAALSSPRLRVVSAVLLIALGVVAVVALRALHDRARRVEVGSGRGPVVLPATLATAAVVAAAAGLLGPRLPGAGDDPWYETRGRGGGVTEIASPLVDIRSRLINQGNVELFRVNATTDRYWRETTLADFDGSTWRLPKQPLSDGVDRDLVPSDAVAIRQQLQIVAYARQLLPAAADVYQVSASNPETEVKFNVDGSTLLTENVAPGDQFTIVSFEPDPGPELLRSTSGANPPEPVFLELPDDLPDVVGRLARDVTDGATTDYDRMLALQAWFRQFDYSTEVQAGHGSSAIENFLEIRIGYCEQFAATFAAMARTLGVPSRVAVGYTPGLLGADGWYSVLGKNSHAWPEIWFDGVGWIPFEPTPGRGIPGATDYTGLEPDQETEGQTTNGDEVSPGTLPPVPTTVFAPATTIRPLPNQVNDPEASRNRTRATTPAANTRDGSSPLPTVVAVVAGVVALGCVAPAVSRRLARRGRRRRPFADRVEASWRRACRAAAHAGVAGTAAMTAPEWATATARSLPVAARPMASLATAVDRVEFARPGSWSLDPALLDRPRLDCELWAEQVERIASDTLTTRQRLRRYFTDWR